MPELLRCPTCSAPLDAPALHDTTARCPYCRSSILLDGRAGASGNTPNPQSAAVAEVLRLLSAGNKIAAIKVFREQFGGGLKEAKEAVERLEATLPPGTVPRPNAAKGLIGCLALVLVVGIVVVMANRRGASPPAAGSPRPVAGSPAPPAAPATPPSPPAFADVVLRFGSEGTGAGRFEDARSVAVDGAGRIYVAEYSGGRVQVFDSLGTFVTQWTADPKMPMVDMEVDRGGTVYVVQSGRIRRYEGATGRLLGTVDGAGQNVNDLVLALDGTLWAASGMADVVHLSRGGAMLRRVDLRQAVDDAAPARLAVSGTGEVYALDRWTQEIYRLDAAGKFVDRFGGKGDGPEQFRWAMDLAIDGRGRVYVSDMMRGIRVFDAAGHFVDAFGEHELVFGMAFDDHDGLYTAQRNNHQIVKFRLKR
ncbi:MAG TPA: 6-bladed beta-propeller [Longimicrobium sp.]|nr:6-bladed beta-propeller [Longimicrobium sp.]